MRCHYSWLICQYTHIGPFPRQWCTLIQANSRCKIVRDWSMADGRNFYSAAMCKFILRQDTRAVTSWKWDSSWPYLALSSTRDAHLHSSIRGIPRSHFRKVSLPIVNILPNFQFCSQGRLLEHNRKTISASSNTKYSVALTRQTLNKRNICAKRSRTGCTEFLTGHSAHHGKRNTLPRTEPFPLIETSLYRVALSVFHLHCF